MLSGIPYLCRPTGIPGPDLDDKKVAERIVGEVQQIILEAWTPKEIAKVVNQDLDGMELSAQQLLRLAGERLMEKLNCLEPRTGIDGVIRTNPHG